MNIQILRRNYGITVISLIITIVVLLIIATVAIREAKESGMVKYAQKAVEEYDKSQKEEQTILEELEKEMNKINNNNGNNDNNGNNNNNNNNNNGNNNNNNENDLEELTKYLLGPNKEGRNLLEIMDNINTGIFKQDPNNTNSKIHTKLKVAYTEVESTESELINILHLNYNRAIYKVRCSIKIINQNTLEVNTLKDSVSFVKSLEGNLGKYVKYANNTWIVLTDDASGVELISADALGSINFIASSVEDARIKYNDVIESLVSKCKEETGITTNIRCVGSFITDEEELSDTNTVVFRDLKTFSPSVDYSNFAKFEGGANGFRKGNTEYETDYNKMKELGILSADNGAPYWIASRFVYEHNDAIRSYVNFELRYINGGTLLEQIFCCVESYATSNIAYGCDSEDYRAVRPIIMMRSGVLDNAIQSGEIEDPIILN